MAANHQTNLAVVHQLINLASSELENARRAEVGTCTYRHHVEIGVNTGVIACATALATMAAIAEEQLTLMKAVQMVVIHPKEKTDGNKEA